MKLGRFLAAAIFLIHLKYQESSAARISKDVPLSVNQLINSILKVKSEEEEVENFGRPKRESLQTEEPKYGCKPFQIENDCTNLVLKYRNNFKITSDDDLDSDQCSSMERKWIITEDLFFGFIKSVQIKIHRIKSGPLQDLTQTFSSLKTVKVKKEKVKYDVSTVERAINCINTIITAAKSELKVFSLKYEELSKNKVKLVELSLKLYYFKRHMDKVERIHIPFIFDSAKNSFTKIIENYLVANFQSNMDYSLQDFENFQEEELSKLLENYIAVLKYLYNVYEGVTSLEQVMKVLSQTSLHVCRDYYVDIFLLYLQVVQENRLLLHARNLITILEVAKNSNKLEKFKIVLSLEPILPNGDDIVSLDEEVRNLVTNIDNNRLLSKSNVKYLSSKMPITNNRFRRLLTFLQVFRSNGTFELLSQMNIRTLNRLSMETPESVNVKINSFLKSYKTKLSVVREKIDVLVKLLQLFLMEPQQRCACRKELIEKEIKYVAELRNDLKRQKIKVEKVLEKIEYELDILKHSKLNNFEEVSNFGKEVKNGICYLLDLKPFFSRLSNLSSLQNSSEIQDTIHFIFDKNDIEEIRNSVNWIDDDIKGKLNAEKPVNNSSEVEEEKEKIKLSERIVSQNETFSKNENVDNPSNRNDIVNAISPKEENFNLTLESSKNNTALNADSQEKQDDFESESFEELIGKECPIQNMSLKMELQKEISNMNNTWNVAKKKDMVMSRDNDPKIKELIMDLKMNETTLENNVGTENGTDQAISRPKKLNETSEEITTEKSATNESTSEIISTVTPEFIPDKETTTEGMINEGITLPSDLIRINETLPPMETTTQNLTNINDKKENSTIFEEKENIEPNDEMKKSETEKSLKLTLNQSSEISIESTAQNETISEDDKHRYHKRSRNETEDATSQNVTEVPKVLKNCDKIIEIENKTLKDEDNDLPTTNNFKKVHKSF